MIKAMDSFQQSQVFFFVSSVSFVFLWVFVAVFLFYLIRATNTFSRVMDKIEKDMDDIGDVTKETLEEVRNSMIFHFLFKKKKKRRKD